MRRVAFAVAAMLAAAPAAAQSATTPLDKVKAIYERASVFCEGADVAPAYADQFMRSTFEKAIADRFLYKLHRSHFDFDILIDGQDCKLANVSIEQTETTEATAVVRVQFTNFDAARTIDFQFRNTGGQWMVNDMVYRHRKFNLRGFLKLN